MMVGSPQKGRMSDEGLLVLLALLLFSLYLCDTKGMTETDLAHPRASSTEPSDRTRPSHKATYLLLRYFHQILHYFRSRANQAFSTAEALFSEGLLCAVVYP